MKMIKKVAMVLLSLCLVVPCITMVANAAEGEIRFSDPTGQKGQLVNVDAYVQGTGGNNVGEAEVVLKYDSSYLQFSKGEGVTKTSDGELTYKGNGNGDTKLDFSMEFKALKQGETRITISSYTASTGNGDSLQCVEGNSTIVLEEGDGTEVELTDEMDAELTDKKITVDSKEYTLAKSYPETTAPAGFAAKDITYDGETVKMAVQENGGISLAYLVGESDDDSEFFVYDETKSEFYAFEQISISEKYTIIIMRKDKDVKVPSQYQEVNLKLNGHKFPAWQNNENEGFYLIYAVNSEGEKGFYQYDSKEGTYQRYVEADSPSVAEDNSLLGKLTSFIKKHLAYFVVGAFLMTIFFIVVLIILGIKLKHRNSELDDLYDEYGIDQEDDYPVTTQKPAVREQKSRRYSKQDPEEDDFDDYGDDFEDDFGMVTEDLSAVYGNDSLDDTDDLSELAEALGESRDRRKAHIEEDDEFQVDFIDLD